MQFFEQFLQQVIEAVSYFSAVESVATLMIWHKYEYWNAFCTKMLLNYYAFSIVIIIAFWGFKVLK